jgi:UDP:flavonoid glycosyltransferase YjiC (YdhE family)
MRIVFATTRGAGHLGPLIPIARACMRAGHDVLVAGHPEVAPHAGRARLPFHAIAKPAAEPVAELNASIARAPMHEAMQRAVRDFYVRCHARAALPSMIAAIETWDADLVVRETCEFASCVAAERLDVPQVRVGMSLSSAAEDLALAYAAPALDELREVLWLEPDPEAERARRVPLIKQAPRALDDRGHRAAGRILRYRDTSEAPEPLPDWWDDSDAPLVYVTFGTEVPQQDFFPGLYRAAIDAVATLPVRVLVTIGDTRDPQELGPLPPSVHVERWVSQSSVMPEAAAIVAHGGAGTTLAGMGAGVPMALVPLLSDQPDNAARVAAAGAGIVLEGGPAAVAGLRDAVRALLEQPRYRTAADRVAAGMRLLPPVDAVAGWLEAIAGRPALAA